MIFLCVVLELHGLKLHCDFRTKNWDHVEGEACESSFHDILSPNEIITEVNSFNGSVKIIEIYRKTINYVPQGFGENFPEVEGLQIYDSKLKVVQKMDFAQFPNLKELLLNQNELQILPADLFEDNLAIVCIEMESNKLIAVAANILAPLKKLEQVRFYGNPCIDQGAENQTEVADVVTFLSLGCINELIEKYEKIKQSIDNCEERLEVVDGNLDAATYQLFVSTLIHQEKEISLEVFGEKCTIDSNITVSVNSTSNKNETLPATSNVTCNQIPIRQNFPTIKIRCNYDDESEKCEALNLIVDIPNSKIEKVEDENGLSINQDLHPIQKMSIVNQQTLFLPTNIGEFFKDLTELIIFASGFFRIDDETFANLTSLTSLAITQNKVREVCGDCFRDNVNLLVLDLGFNRIEVIAEKAFVHLGNLSKLILQNNLLTSVTADTFANLSSLETLNLKHNKISFINSDLISWLPNLSYFDISSKFYFKNEKNLIVKTFESFQTTKSSIFLEI